MLSANARSAFNGFGIQRLQLAKELAKRVRRLAACPFVAGLRDQRAKARTIEARPFAPPGGRAPPGSAISRSRHCSSACWRAASIAWPCAHWSSWRRIGSGSTSRISLPTYWSLPLAATPCGDRARLDDRIDEPGGQRGFGGELGEPLRIEGDERLAHVLQRVHLGLAPRLGRRRGRAAHRVSSGGLRCHRRARRRRSRSSGRGIVLAESGRVGVGRGIRACTLCYDSPASSLPHRSMRQSLRRILSMTASPHPDSSDPARAIRVADAARTRRRSLPFADGGNRARRESRARAGEGGGATAAETDVSQAVGQSVTVRRGEVETVAYNRDKGIGVTVYLGQRRGHASTADFSDGRHAGGRGQGARHRAVHGGGPRRRARRSRAARARRFPDLDLYDPWELAVEDAVTLGCEAEAAALAVDRRITNTEGATVAWNESEFVYANSNGFAGGYRSTRHHIDCAVIGDPGDGGVMQRDYWYTDRTRSLRPSAGSRSRAHRRRADGAPAQRAQARHARLSRAVRGAGGGRSHRFVRRRGVGRRAVPQIVVPARFARHSRCSRRTCRFARIRTSRARAAARRSTTKAWRRRRATSCATASCAAISSAATRRASSAWSRPATPAAATISWSRMATTTSPALMRRMGRGLFVTEQLGQGVNPVTGDYSRGAAGFWIEDGAIAYPVEEITIAGNLKRHLPRHRGDRARRRSPRLASHGIHPGRPDDRGRALSGRPPRSRLVLP